MDGPRTKAILAASEGARKRHSLTRGGKRELLVVSINGQEGGFAR
jgi:hypothetical protein